MTIFDKLTHIPSENAELNTLFTNMVDKTALSVDFAAMPRGGPTPDMFANAPTYEAARRGWLEYRRRLINSKRRKEPS